MAAERLATISCSIHSFIHSCCNIHAYRMVQREEGLSLKRRHGPIVEIKLGAGREKYAEFQGAIIASAAGVPADRDAMGAQKTYGITRALLEGQIEPEGQYEAKSILLTGGAGFIASHVVIHLVQRYPNTKVSWGTVLKSAAAL